MNAPEHFEFLDGYCRYGLVGQGSLEEAAGKVIRAIAYAREQNARQLLIDTTKWTGHASPSTLERYYFASEFTQAAGSAIKMAMIVRPEMMDPTKFEVTVATNRGMSGNVFDSEAEALDWLLGPKVR